jgi:hypothetical protein
LTFVVGAVAAALAVLALAALAGPALATTSSCGTVRGVTIHAKGGVSCSTARTVYSRYEAGHTPHGWACSGSRRECGRGHQSVTWSGGGQGQGQGQGQG